MPLLAVGSPFGVLNVLHCSKQMPTPTFNSVRGTYFVFFNGVALRTPPLPSDESLVSRKQSTSAETQCPTFWYRGCDQHSCTAPTSVKHPSFPTYMLTFSTSETRHLSDNNMCIGRELNLPSADCTASAALIRPDSAEQTETVSA
ncbi:unnamed protein product, partial [Sphacelaria rigidula]